ncbi:unnamed protein product [Ectocarpus sp. 12 AP-2014]
MATAGASGVSLALGIYNTTQIASLKETIDSISGSMSGAGSGSSVLAPTVVKPIEVVRPVETIQRATFQQASSPEVEELQERVDALEIFSNSVSNSSASNSTGLATKLGELDLFANASSTRSSTNDSNIVMLNDELDRLNNFTTEEIPKVRERVAKAEESMETNASTIETLSTRARDLETGVSAADTRIDAVVALAAAIDASLKATKTSVAQSAGAIEQVSTAVTQLTQGVDKLGDDLDLVDGNEEETRKNLADLTRDWNVLKSRAYLTNGLLNAVNLRATNCNLGLTPHNGQTSALHFAGITDPNWAMYMSNASGKGPDGKKVHAHGDVTNNAVRLKLGANKKSGFILENDKNVGVFSVNTEGKTRMGAGKIADVTPGTHTSFSHHAQHGIERCAISQTDRGVTILNAAKGQELHLRTGNTGAARVAGTRFDVLNTGRDANQTHFDHDGSNFISCDWKRATYFRAGKSGPRARYDKHGFYVGDMHVENELQALKRAVQDLKGEVNKKVSKDQSVYLYSAKEVYQRQWQRDPQNQVWWLKIPNSHLDLCAQNTATNTSSFHHRLLQFQVVN